MKGEIAFRNSTRDSFCGSRLDSCTRAYFETGGQAIAGFDPFNWLANKAVTSAGGKSAVFGSKPGVASYSATDLGTAADTAAKSNLSNMPDIMAMLDKITPGFSEELKQGGKNTMALLRGEIPQDVQDLVRRNSAYQSLMGGYAGSGLSKALTARDFGRTSLDLMQLGGNSAQKWAGLSQASVAPFMVTAPAEADATFRNNLYTQATEQNRLNVAAAPDPGAAGTFNLQVALGMTAASMGMGSAMGGMRGGATANAGNNTGNNYAGTYNGVPYNNNQIPTANAVPWGSYTAGANYNPNAYNWGGWGG
jgi:hypothetical protein